MKNVFQVFFTILFMAVVGSSIILAAEVTSQEEYILLLLEDEEYAIPHNAKEEDILDLFGKESVHRTEVHVGEGFYERGLVVFPDTKKELEVHLHAYEDPSSIREIVFSHRDSPWRTREGIQKGISLKELVEINEGHFTFLGLAWDYGGLVISWDEGELQGTPYRVMLDIPPPSEEEYHRIPESLMGDGTELSSCLPIFSTWHLEIYWLSILVPST